MAIDKVRALRLPIEAIIRDVEASRSLKPNVKADVLRKLRAFDAVYIAQTLEFNESL
jgi:hypothetical protein